MSPVAMLTDAAHHCTTEAEVCQIGQRTSGNKSIGRCPPLCPAAAVAILSLSLFQLWTKVYTLKDEADCGNTPLERGALAAALRSAQQLL